MHATVGGAPVLLHLGSSLTPDPGELDKKRKKVPLDERCHGLDYNSVV